MRTDLSARYYCHAVIASVPTPGNTSLTELLYGGGKSQSCADDRQAVLCLLSCHWLTGALLPLSTSLQETAKT